jgi:D-alanyl-D-alanine carboxypeptidase
MISASGADVRASRRRLLRAGLAAPLAVALAGRPTPAVCAPEVDARQDQRIAELVATYMNAYGVPGLSLAYGRGSEFLLVRAYGVANRTTNEPVGTGSLFRIASVSKSITCATIFTFVEQGRIRLTDRVFAPDGLLHAYADKAQRPEWVQAITVHDLLTHTAGGWPNDETDPMFGHRELDAPKLIAQTLATQPPQYPPGQHYAYSNFGYCILGRVIEAASAMKYDACVRERILAPLRIDDMQIAAKEPVAREVRYYRESGEDPYGLPIARMDSHGGWIATPTDLVRFCTGLFAARDHSPGPPLLTASSLATIVTGTRANASYGCGWHLTDTGNVWHTGHLAGTQALLVHAKNGLVWAVVINTRNKRVPAMTSAMDKLMWDVRNSVPQWGR